MQRKPIGIGVALAASILATDSHADGPAADNGRDWTGLYVGGHLGYAAGGSDWTAFGAGGVETGSLDFFAPYSLSAGTGSYFAGLQIGYDHKLPSGIVLGLVADVSAPSLITGLDTLKSQTGEQATYQDTVEIFGTVRGRLGYLYNDWLLYGTAGYAWAYDQFVRTQLSGMPAGGTAGPGSEERATSQRSGWTVGAGVELPVAAHWTASLEYLFTAFAAHDVTFPAAAQTFDSALALQTVRVGLNYQFGGEVSGERTGPAAPKSDDWSVHAQTTYVQQYAFPFRSPYVGEHSFIPNQTRETWDATFYIGWKLWSGAELWVNPEIDQGFGLSNTLGIAGFPSGEAYKAGANFPYARIPRYFIRQTISFGGDAEDVEAGTNQFAGKQSKDRLVVTAGKFAVTDVFDVNKYAHDPRVDFLNWALIDTGTFDYAADAWGLTYGAALEWYWGPWTLRAGLFDLPREPNSMVLDPAFKQVQWVGELERRYKLWGQPGRLAITSFLSEGRMGRFSDAIQLAAGTGEPPDLAAVRRFQGRLGVSANLEQQLSADIGMFMRAGWADGRFEPFAFTDIDSTVAAGLAISGSSWGRSDDTLGIAAVVNGISGEHEAYLDAGGLTALLGDGKLPHPGLEQIIETYYSFPLLGLRATVDYQFVENPGYNRDRGPVSIIGTRLRANF